MTNDFPHDPLNTEPTPLGEGTMSPSTGNFVRDTDNKMVAGICSAIARRTGWDLNLVRAAVALGAILTSGTVLIVYLVMWAVIPAAGSQTTALTEAMKEGRKFYDTQKAKKDAASASAQPGPAPHTPGHSATTDPTHPGTNPADPDPYDLYKD